MQVETHKFRFFGNETPPVVGSPDGVFWRSKKTASGGSPTIVGAGGAMVLTLDSTSEVQNLCLYLGDILPFDIDALQQVDFWAKLTAGVETEVSAAFGVASARNDAIDSLGEAALFRIIGDDDSTGTNPVTVETDDGTNDNDDKAAGGVLVATYKRCTIDFASGIKSISPGPSVGGKGNVLFSMDDAQGNLRPVARTTQFDMSNYAAGLQLYAQIQKTSSDRVAVLSIRGIDVRVRV